LGYQGTPFLLQLGGTLLREGLVAGLEAGDKALLAKGGLDILGG
jgi:hypothetical protein